MNLFAAFPALIFYFFLLGVVSTVATEPPSSQKQPPSSQKQPPSSQKQPRKFVHPRSKNHHGTNPNKKKLKISRHKPLDHFQFSNADDSDPTLARNGKLKVIWADECEDGYYDWSWKKFERWVAYNWNQLSIVEQVAVNTLRELYQTPNDWGSKGTERHHFVPKCCGGRPGFDQKWCISLSYAHHLIVHICLMVLVKDSEDSKWLTAAVNKMMFGAPKKITEVSEIILEAGASKEILEAYVDYKAKEHELHSERMKGEGNPMFGKRHSDESLKKMSKAKKGKTWSKQHKERIGAGVAKAYEEGRWTFENYKSGEDHYLYGKTLPEATRKKLADAKCEWTKEQDMILAMIACEQEGKTLKLWAEVTESVLWKDLPPNLATTKKAKERMSNLKQRGIVGNDNYWNDLIAEAKERLAARPPRPSGAMTTSKALHEHKKALSAIRSDWTKEHDMILALIVCDQEAKGDKQIKWPETIKSDLFKQLPRKLATQPKASTRISSLKRRGFLNNKNYWNELMAEARELSATAKAPSAKNVTATAAKERSATAKAPSAKNVTATAAKERSATAKAPSAKNVTATAAKERSATAKAPSAKKAGPAGKRPSGAMTTAKAPSAKKVTGGKRSSSAFAKVDPNSPPRRRPKHTHESLSKNNGQWLTIDRNQKSKASTSGRRSSRQTIAFESYFVDTDSDDEFLRQGKTGKIDNDDAPWGPHDSGI